ncbi:ABC transporter ATP-binding protein [Streptomyces somaliensis]|uniref:ABC transporter ATP-binding protein n=1 Tax=Streptomyces somaliensis TaxID=78355 RepID=UPI0020CE6F49|nr:ABC transporter ATP-binding protein [Streptomyces somaliensis]MCP9944173.1 ABC transporter ATP-binding protein [Streptomyces somaliensis]MCP9962591.1 ABC transporter ATP-binding protein [Streptomyces somaliensis]MCP9975419.1 ABC transporter ATP-binding protein [Streptomyces somaliensis]
MSENVAIVATQVGKTFAMGKQAVTALRDVSLSLPTGTLTALTGPSGSGKSTLLHLIAGLERVDSGTLTVLGHRVHTCSQAELAALRLREIGFVHQDFSLLADLTLVENVRLPLEATGTARGDATAAAREAMARVGLEGLEQRFPAEVSGGQQQRAAIARAIVGSRTLVLADEPTGSLDSKTGAEIMDVLGQLRDQGVTVVLSTHNPANLSHADQVVVLHDGTLLSYESHAGGAA